MDARHWSVPIRPAIAELQDSLIRRISEEGMGRDGVIPLWFGEPDAPTPEFIKDAAAGALSADHTFYAPNRGVPALRTLLTTRLRRCRASRVARHCSNASSGNENEGTILRSPSDR